MKRNARLFTALIVGLFADGCATTGPSLQQFRADYDQAEAERLSAETEAAAAAKRQSNAEERKRTAGKALATGLVSAAKDDVKAAETATKRAREKRDEACKLNPDLPECKSDQPASPTPAAEPPAPAEPNTGNNAPPTAAAPVEPPPTPNPPPTAAPPLAPTASTSTDSLYFEIVIDTEHDGRHQTNGIIGPKGWALVWKSHGVLKLVVDSKEVRSFDRPKPGCYRAFRDRNEEVTCQ